MLVTAPVETAGVYYINATGIATVDYNDSAVYCYVSFSSQGAQTDGIYGAVYNLIDASLGENTGGSLAVTDYWQLAVGDSGELYCFSDANDPFSSFQSFSMTMTLVQNSDQFLRPGSTNVNARPVLLPKTPRKGRRTAGSEN